MVWALVLDGEGGRQQAGRYVTLGGRGLGGKGGAGRVEREREAGPSERTAGKGPSGVQDVCQEVGARSWEGEVSEVEDQ